MVLVAAYELKLIVLPNWQSEFGLIYRVIGIGFGEDGEDAFAAFERNLTAIIPKIELLARRGTALRDEAQVRLDVASEL
jgi:hypothetical protein